MSLVLSHDVPSGAIKTFFNDQNKPWFISAD